MAIKIQFGSGAKGKVYTIDPMSVMHLAAGAWSAFSGAPGVPTALNSAANALKGMDVKSADSFAVEGLAFYIACLSQATCELLNEKASNFEKSDKTIKEIESLIESAFKCDTLILNHGTFSKPSLNPSFVRYKEQLVSILKRMDHSLIEPEQADSIGRLLGRKFAIVAAETLNRDSEGNFSNIINFLNKPANSESQSRAEMWLDYEAHLNEQVYRNLFLHELEGHPDVSLADLYVSSRGIFVDKKRDDDAEIIQESNESCECTLFHLTNISEMNGYLKNQRRPGMQD